MFLCLINIFFLDEIDQIRHIACSIYFHYKNIKYFNNKKWLKSQEFLFLEEFLIVFIPSPRLPFKVIDALSILALGQVQRLLASSPNRILLLQLRRSSLAPSSTSVSIVSISSPFKLEFFPLFGHIDFEL